MKSSGRSTKGDMQMFNDWNGDDTNLSDRVLQFCKDFNSRGTSFS